MGEDIVLSRNSGGSFPVDTVMLQQCILWVVLFIFK